MYDLVVVSIVSFILGNITGIACGFVKWYVGRDIEQVIVGIHPVQQEQVEGL